MLAYVTDLHSFARSLEYSDRLTDTHSGQFNLDIEEVQFVRDAMAAWRENVHLPLTISVYLDSESPRHARVLLEQWSVVYAPEQDAQDALGRRTGLSLGHASTSRDVIQQLKEVCKKISVLLRSLYSFMRLLPAHRLVRRGYPSSLSYELHSAAASPASLERAFERDVAISRYSFVPIPTPFGYLKISTVYRLNCELMRDEEEATQPALFKENFIIQDYVPSSPELLAQRDDVDRTSLSPSSAFGADRPDAGAALETLEQQQRRRSSPPQIAADDVASRRTQSLSRPMAIPQTKAPSAFDESVTSPRDGHSKAMHAHSYGDPDRLRAVGANPNVTAAPYGYGNVAIERGQTPSPPVPVPPPATSYQDESSSHFPLSTPPRHPNSLLSLKHSRTFSSSAGSRKGSSDGTQYRSSLENFSLDDGSAMTHSPAALSPSPSPGVTTDRSARDRAATFSYSSRRHESFSGAFASDESVSSTGATGGGPGRGIESSPRLTPPFMYADAPAGAMESPSSTAALVLRRATPETSASRGVPVFASSPPFQANPTELLSTSPGYSYSKNYLHKGPSNLPMFVTTDQFQLGRSGAFRLNAGAPGFGKSAGQAMDHRGGTHARGFSSDLYEAGAGVWGVSPDSPDAFGLALTSSSGIGSNRRHRFLSSSSSSATGGERREGETSAASHDADDDDPYDMSDLLLPFALGDGDGASTATTVTSTVGSELSRASGAESSGSADVRGSKGETWDTASVGSFLNQLKHAPRLQSFQSTAAPASRSDHDSASDARESDRSSSNNSRVPAPQLLFEDELASFRSLRDELARDL